MKEKNALRKDPPNFFETALFQSTPWFWKTPEGKSYIEALGTPKALERGDEGLLESSAIPEVPALSPWEAHKVAITGCHLCPKNLLSSPPYHQFTELGEGTDFLFVTDFPHHQALWGGPQGELVKNLLAALPGGGKKVVQTSLVKCRPSFEREEDKKAILLKNCLSYLNFEIIELRPRFIIAFGATVTMALLERKERLSLIHGQRINQLFCFEDKTITCEVVPVFHPDYLLINPQMKRSLWNDLLPLFQELQK